MNILPISNKETIRNNQNTLVCCDCCVIDVLKYKFPRHCRSKKHIKKKSQYIENKSVKEELILTAIPIRLFWNV